MKASDYLKEIERKQGKQAEKEHTLRENALERAKHPTDLNAGTAFDWEEVEAYEEEFKRMQAEGGKRYISRKEREQQATDHEDLDEN